jgi:predicted aminopeptidase
MKFIFVILAAALLSSCQIGYMVKSGYHQMALLSKRVPIDEALKDPNLDAATKNKLILSQEVRRFAEQELKLASTKNYTSYVQLEKPYVSYVVSAAPKFKLEHYLWWFPIVGKIPYKGFSTEEDAKDEQTELKNKNLDTYLRGVSAYSTLGWFNDPLLSSMMRSKEFHLVNTIIHETVHATLYIKSSADFNERMAVFLGNKGTDLFYQMKEGTSSPTLKQIQAENEDDRIFSVFIGDEITALTAWYEKQPEKNPSEEDREKRFTEIKNHFAEKVQPYLKTDVYKKFGDSEINNARLMLYKTYMQDLSDFEKLFELTKGSYHDFLKCCEKLKKADHPEEGLKQIIGKLTENSLSTCENLEIKF